MRFRCESCDASLSIDDERVRGKRLVVRCKRCGARIQISDPAYAVGPAATLLASAAPAAGAAPPRPAPAASPPPGPAALARPPAVAGPQRSAAASDAVARARAALARSSRGLSGADLSGPPPVRRGEEPIWYAMIAGQQEGPLAPSEVARRMRGGAIGPRTLVWKEGMGSWERSSEVPELAALLAALTLSGEPRPSSPPRPVASRPPPPPPAVPKTVARPAPAPGFARPAPSSPAEGRRPEAMERRSVAPQPPWPAERERRVQPAPPPEPQPPPQATVAAEPEPLDERYLRPLEDEPALETPAPAPAPAAVAESEDLELDLDLDKTAAVAGPGAGARSAPPVAEADLPRGDEAELELGDGGDLELDTGVERTSAPAAREAPPAPETPRASEAQARPASAAEAKAPPPAGAPHDELELLPVDELHPAASKAAQAEEPPPTEEAAQAGEAPPTEEAAQAGEVPPAEEAPPPSAPTAPAFPPLREMFEGLVQRSTPLLERLRQELADPRRRSLALMGALAFVLALLVLSLALCGRSSRPAPQRAAAGGPAAGPVSPAPQERSVRRDERPADEAEQRPDRPLGAPAVARTLQRGRGALQACVDEALRRDRSLRVGRIHLTATVAPSGTVIDSAIDNERIDGSQLGACLKHTARQMSFPPFAGEPVEVDIPLVLGSGG